MKHKMSRNEKCVYVPCTEEKREHKMKERVKINFEIFLFSLFRWQVLLKKKRSRVAAASAARKLKQPNEEKWMV